MERYLDADDSLVGVFLDVVDSRFGSLMNLKFKLIYDTKKRMKQGKIVLASIELCNPKLKFFSADDIAVDGYDYIIIVDHKAWELCNDADKKRIISHELQHVFVNEAGDCKLIGHDIADFYIEIQQNQDDPEWAKNLSELTFAIYEQEKEDAKQPKAKAQ
jgi:hypothetical protein